jgi:hypothetical protein
LLALLGAYHILHVSRRRVNGGYIDMKCKSEVAFVTKHERKAANAVDHSSI